MWCLGPGAAAQTPDSGDTELRSEGRAQCSHTRGGERSHSHTVTRWSHTGHKSQVTLVTLVKRDMEMEMEHYYEDSHLLESATPYTDAIRVSQFVNICIFTSYLKVEKICRKKYLN